MPQMGVSVAEGTIVEWTKRPGDWVERDETVCLVTTDKVDVEIPSPAAGRLSRILVEQGDTVDVGTPLAELDVGARPGEAHPEEHHPEPPPAAVTETDGETDRSGFHSPVVRRMADAARHRPLAGRGHGNRRPHPQARSDRADRERPAPLHTESPYQPETPARLPSPTAMCCRASAASR